MQVLAEMIASDASLLVTFNHAIEGVISEQSEGESQSQSLGSIGRIQEAAGVGSLSMNLQRFGMERVSRVETLQEIIQEMSETAENPVTAAHSE